MFEVKYSEKDSLIERINKYEVVKLIKKYNLNINFSFEYYTSKFNFNDDNTYIYYAFQLL